MDTHHSINSLTHNKYTSVLFLNNYQSHLRKARRSDWPILQIAQPNSEVSTCFALITKNIRPTLHGNYFRTPFYFFILFLGPPRSIWSSQSRDQIRATVATCVAAAAVPGPSSQLCCAGDRPCVLMVQRLCQSCGATAGTPRCSYFCFYHRQWY